MIPENRLSVVGRLTVLAIALLRPGESGSQVPVQTAVAAVSVPCDSLQQLLRAPAPRRLRVVRDTLLPGPGVGASWPRRGCVLQLADPAGHATFVTEAVDHWFRARGWIDALEYSADGPDGTLFGFVRGQQLCLVQGSWDGGDDSDSTYVPQPGYEVTVGCVPAVPSDTAS